MDAPGAGGNGVRLGDLAQAVAVVAAEPARSRKTAVLAQVLRRARAGQAGLAVRYLSGELRQRRTGVGHRSLVDLPPEILARLNHASAKSVDSVSLSLSGNQRIFWGSAEGNAPKAKVLEALLKVPAADPPVKEYDVSTPDRPVTR